MAQALFGDFEEGDFEEVLYDFFLTAAQETDPEGGKDGGANDEEFDYDAHIRSLIEKAERQRLGDGDDGRGRTVTEGHAAAADDAAFFSGARNLRDRGGEGDVNDDDSLDREFGVRQRRRRGARRRVHPGSSPRPSRRRGARTRREPPQTPAGIVGLLLESA